jgi:hypothetical protein
MRRPAGDLRRERREALLQYFDKVFRAISLLPPDKRAEFEEWDQNRTDGRATSDWPGFEALIGSRPGSVSDRRREAKRVLEMNCGGAREQ